MGGSRVFAVLQLCMLCAVCYSQDPQQQQQQECTSSCPEPDGSMTWNSDILGTFEARAGNVTWHEDPRGSTKFVVQFREKQSGAIYNKSATIIGSLSYEIVGLNPNTEYEIRVCRANGSTTEADNCGNCLKCFMTLIPDEPPSEPVNLQVVAEGPNIVSIDWEPPEITNGDIDSYYLVCRREDNTIVFSTTTMSRSETVFVLSPNTTYVCSVAAVNTHGMGNAASREVTTPPVNTILGLLLLVFSDSIEYVSLDDRSFEDLTATLDDKVLLLDVSTDSVEGIDYHFYREEIYTTTQSGLINQHTLGVTSDDAGVTGLVIVNTTVLVNRSGNELGSIAVDWVEDDLYWIENNNTIMRMSIDGNTTPYCVVPPSPVRHLAVDPVHGYIYWNGDSIGSMGETGLYRVDLDDVRVETLSCSSSSDLPDAVEFITATNLETFTLESDTAIYYIGTCNEMESPFHNSRTIQTTSLNAENTECVSTGVSAIPETIASFSEIIFFPLPGNLNGLTLIANATETNGSPQGSNAGAPVSILRTYRSVKQPLPVPPSPPTNIEVCAKLTTATISWQDPQFVGNFFGVSAFTSWDYILNYTEAGLLDLVTVNTTATTVTLSGLEPGTLYQFTISARGPGGERVSPSSFVFQTRSQALDNSGLLVATDQGVVQADIDGSNADYISRERSSGSIGAVYNFHTDIYYWIISGGRSSVYMHDNKTGETVAVYEQELDNPFSLKLDWVARRLFWIETGDTTSSEPRIVSASTETFSEGAEAPEVVSEGDEIRTSTLDSTNGLVFWVMGGRIFYKTLNGLMDSTLCFFNTATPTAMAVDVSNQLLYWLDLSPTGVVRVNQMRYTTEEGCIGSPEVRDIFPDRKFSSSPNVLAYGGGMLFVTASSMDVIYTLPANLSAIGTEQTIAVGTLQLDILSPTPETFRDVQVLSEYLQPLPAGLTTTGLAAVTPGLPSEPERAGDPSMRDKVVVQWGGAPPLSFSSLLVYRVDYSLAGVFDGSMDSGSDIVYAPGEFDHTSSLTLNVTGFTSVSVNITTATVWVANPTQVEGNFNSFPEPPQQVQDVRVNVYFPLRGDDSTITALVVWTGLTPLEAGGIVDTYTVRVFQEGGVELTTLTQNGDNRTQYSIEQRNGFATLTYPLEANRTYTVQVFASNEGGDGVPSNNVTFSTNAPNPPEVVLAVGAAGGMQVGQDPGDMLSVTPPLDVDTKNRIIYWYSDETTSVLSQPLDGGDVTPLVVSDSVLLALSYDWVGEVVYFARPGSGNVLSLWKLPVINPQGLEIVYPTNETPEEARYTVSAEADVQLAVDPFRGYAYWTTGEQVIYQLNLSNPTSPTLLPSSSRKKRQTDIAALNLTSALTLDPSNGTLWVCNADSGDILSCDPISQLCSVEVNASALISGGGTLEDVGLPASSIALDETRIYWTREGSGVFYVTREDRTTAMPVAGGNNASAIITLSPGQQPLPSTNCLAPVNVRTSDRPFPTGLDITNTTVLIGWDTTELPPECDDVVVSFATLTFGVDVELGMDTIPGFPQDTFDTQLLVTGLKPWVEYGFSVSATNRYSTRRFGGDFGIPNLLRTAEGVPDPPQNVSYDVLGTQEISLTWNEPDTARFDLTNTLRGPTEELEYFIDVNGTRVNSTAPNIILTDIQLSTPAELYMIEVFVSNGALTSNATVVFVTTLALPPLPVERTKTNMSISVTVALDTPDHDNIERLFVEAIFADDLSNCNSILESTTAISSTPTQERSSEPLNFTVGSLEPFTGYCVRAVGTYQNRTGTPEVRRGPEAYIKTDVGVPDAPVLTIEGDIVQWDAPDSNSQDPIMGYRIEAWQVEAPPNTTAQSEQLSQFGREFNLVTQPLLTEEDVEYNIRVYASNDEGESNGSNIVSFIKPSDDGSDGLPQEAVLGIAAGATAIFIIVCMAVFICIFCIALGSRNKRSLRMSYMYGPDVELSNLRDAYRQTHAANPHYMWSRDDYVCTDEDLEQLTRFPRQNLKLETFIDRGEFGEVYQGTAIDILGPAAGPTPVAVKTLRKGSTPDEQRKFLSEAALMGNFNHDNIVKVLGVCVDNDPIYIIMELMPGGDLLKFLRDARRDHGPALLTLTEQIQVALNVAHGCRYLEQQHFIHRDIAARNCLVSSRGADRVVKIGDFGLAKDLYSSDYYQVEGQRKLPVRWMAPEALLQGRFTMESDIWSYGVLLWEIMTLGNQPYPGQTNQEVLQFVTGGGRLDRPERCPGRIYHLMQNCWKKYASERPPFANISTLLENFLEHLNRRPDSMYESSEDEEGGPDGVARKGSHRGSGPSRTPSIRSGIIHLARQGSLKLRNSLRRHGSIHNRREDHNHHLSTEEGQSFRERGPF